MTLGTFPGREFVDAEEAQRKATYVYVCASQAELFSHPKCGLHLGPDGRPGVRFWGVRGSNSESPYGHQNPPQKWIPSRPKSGPPAAHGGQNSVHILDAKMVPPIHFIKPGGPQKRPRKNAVMNGTTSELFVQTVA